jgi:hypothetical protein
VSLKKHATSLVLLVAAAGLGVYAWLDRSSVSVDEHARRDRNVFTAWRKDELTRISLTHDKDQIVLVRAIPGDGMWKMTAPWEGEVDAAIVDRFLSTLEFATVVRKVEGQVPGFDTPRAKGTLEMGAVKYEFALGPIAPTPEGAAYFRMNGASPIVVGKELATDLMKGPDAFRTRTLVPYLSLDLAKLEVRGRANSFTVERKGTERTFLLPERGLRASRERLDKVWRAFAEMRAEAFVTDADAEKAVAEPLVRITMTPKDGRPRGELLVGGPCPGQPNDLVVVQRSPTKTAACAPKGILDGLTVTEGWLTDTRLFALHDDEIEEARLQASPTGAVLDIARKGMGFRELAPQQRDLSEGESDAAGVLVKALAAAEGEVLGRDGSNALRSGIKGRVTLTHAEAGEEETIELGLDDDQGGVYVHRLADGALLRVSAETARKLAPRATSLRPRALWPEPLAGKPIVSIDTKCNGLTQKVTREGDAFRLEVDGAQIAADSGAILDAIDALSRARADAWVADTDDGSFGLAPGGCFFRAVFADEGGTRAAGVSFGGDAILGTYARIEGDPAVFLAPTGLRSKLVAPFLDRHRLAVDPYALVAIEVVRKGVRRSFDPHAKDDAGILLGDDAAGIVTETMHMGPARAGEGFDAPVEIILHLARDAGKPDLRFTVGAPTERAGRKMRFVRVPGVDATMAAPASPEDALGRLLGRP